MFPLLSLSGCGSVEGMGKGAQSIAEGCMSFPSLDLEQHHSHGARLTLGS